MKLNIRFFERKPDGNLISSLNRKFALPVKPGLEISSLKQAVEGQYFRAINSHLEVLEFLDGDDCNIEWDNGETVGDFFTAPAQSAGNEKLYTLKVVRRVNAEEEERRRREGTITGGSFDMSRAVPRPSAGGRDQAHTAGRGFNRDEAIPSRERDTAEPGVIPQTPLSLGRKRRRSSDHHYREPPAGRFQSVQVLGTNYDVQLGQSGVRSARSSQSPKSESPSEPGGRQLPELPPVVQVQDSLPNSLATESLPNGDVPMEDPDEVDEVLPTQPPQSAQKSNDFTTTPRRQASRGALQRSSKSTSKSTTPSHAVWDPSSQDMPAPQPKTPTALSRSGPSRPGQSRPAIPSKTISTEVLVNGEANDGTGINTTSVLDQTSATPGASSEPGSRQYEGNVENFAQNETTASNESSENHGDFVTGTVADEDVENAMNVDVPDLNEEIIPPPKRNNPKKSLGIPTPRTLRNRSSAIPESSPKPILRKASMASEAGTSNGSPAISSPSLQRRNVSFSAEPASVIGNSEEDTTNEWPRTDNLPAQESAPLSSEEDEAGNDGEKWAVRKRGNGGEKGDTRKKGNNGEGSAVSRKLSKAEKQAQAVQDESDKPDDEMDVDTPKVAPSKKKSSPDAEKKSSQDTEEATKVTPKPASEATSKTTKAKRSATKKASAEESATKEASVKESAKKKASAKESATKKAKAKESVTKKAAKEPVATPATPANAVIQHNPVRKNIEGPPSADASDRVSLGKTAATPRAKTPATDSSYINRFRAGLFDLPMPVAAHLLASKAATATPEPAAGKTTAKTPKGKASAASKSASKKNGKPAAVAKVDVQEDEEVTPVKDKAVKGKSTKSTSKSRAGNDDSALEDAAEATETVSPEVPVNAEAETSNDRPQKSTADVLKEIDRRARSQSAGASAQPILVDTAQRGRKKKVNSDLNTVKEMRKKASSPPEPASSDEQPAIAAETTTETTAEATPAGSKSKTRKPPGSRNPNAAVVGRPSSKGSASDTNAGRPTSKGSASGTVIAQSDAQKIASQDATAETPKATPAVGRKGSDERKIEALSKKPDTRNNQLEAMSEDSSESDAESEIPGRSEIVKPKLPAEDSDNDTPTEISSNSNSTSDSNEEESEEDSDADKLLDKALKGKAVQPSQSISLTPPVPVVATNGTASTTSEDVDMPDAALIKQEPSSPSTKSTPRALQQEEEDSFRSRWRPFSYAQNRSARQEPIKITVESDESEEELPLPRSTISTIPTQIKSKPTVEDDSDSDASIPIPPPRRGPLSNGVASLSKGRTASQMSIQSRVTSQLNSEASAAMPATREPPMSSAFGTIETPTPLPGKGGIQRPNGVDSSKVRAQQSRGLSQMLRNKRQANGDPVSGSKVQDSAEKLPNPFADDAEDDDDDDNTSEDDSEDEDEGGKKVLSEKQRKARQQRDANSFAEWTSSAPPF